MAMDQCLRVKDGTCKSNRMLKEDSRSGTKVAVNESTTGV